MNNGAKILASKHRTTCWQWTVPAHLNWICFG